MTSKARKLTQVRLSDREREMLDELARRENLSMAETIRLLVRVRYEQEVGKEKETR